MADDAVGAPGEREVDRRDEGEAARVWVAREDGTVEMRSIKVGSTDGAFAQVTEGLAADEKVVARGSLFIDRAAELRS